MIPPKPSRRPSAAAARETGDNRWFGAFICLVGYFLLVAAIASTLWLPTTPDSPQEGTHRYIMLGLAAAGTGLLATFFGIHFGKMVSTKFISIRRFLGGVRKRYLVPASRRGRSAGRNGAILLGFFLLALSPYLLFESTRTSKPRAVQPTEFALAIPMASEPATANPPTAPDTSVSGPQHAVVFWTLPDPGQSGHPGLLSMVVAAGLIMAFGLLYPQIAASGDQEGKGFVQKLVVPALSLILFGVGVTEQANAEENRENIRLVSQSLPPVINIPESERRGIVLQVEHAPAATTRQLETAIAELTAALRLNTNSNPTDADRDRERLINQLTVLRDRLRDRTTVIDPRVYAELRQTRSELSRALVRSQAAVVDVQNTLRDVSHDYRSLVLSLNDEQQEAFCAVLMSQLATSNANRNTIVSLMERRDSRDAENVFRRVWLGVVGRNRQSLATERERLAETQRADGEALIGAVRVCQGRPGSRAAAEATRR